MYVCSSILNRVPTHATTEPAALWKALESRCKSFRFVDLPAELRNAVYSTVFVKNTPVQIAAGQRTPLPKLLHSSRQMRNEAISIYYAEMHFTADAREWNLLRGARRHPDGRGVHDMCMGDWWIVLPNATHLRRVTIQGYARRGLSPMAIELRFHETRGLLVTYPDGMRATMKALLERRVERVRAKGKELDWKGECILEVVMKNSNVWNVVLDCGRVG